MSAGEETRWFTPKCQPGETPVAGGYAVQDVDDEGNTEGETHRTFSFDVVQSHAFTDGWALKFLVELGGETIAPPIEINTFAYCLRPGGP